MSQHLVTVQNQIEHNKSLISTFNANRIDDALKWRSECQYALQIIRRNADAFARVDPQTVELAMLEVAYSGLSLAPSLGHAYLIPYDDVCTFSPGYKGIVHLCYKANTLARIQPGLHKPGDPEWEVFTDEHGSHIIHRESGATDRSEKPTLHAYIVAKLTNHEIIVTTMDQSALKHVEAAASRRNKKGGMVWRSKFRSQMEIKAVIRRASNYWPRDDGGRLEHAISIIDKHDGLDFEATERRDEPSELLMSEEQLLDLHAALTDRGLPSEEADHWLSMKAQAIGYKAIGEVPARLFDETKASLIDRVGKVKASR